MEKTAYLAISYMCNERCRFCPCSKKDKKEGQITSFEELKNSIDTFRCNGIRKLVISGGEPTLHPRLSDVIRYAQDCGIKIILLSNGERFSETEFLKKFLHTVKLSMLVVITTIHSNRKEEHEDANQTPDSFERTIEGLKKLCDAGATLIVKHCITKRNYQDLSDFYSFIDGTFSEKVSMQMCSIDYCGIPQNLLMQEKLSFPDLKPYLERMFDIHLKRLGEGSKRNVYCINIPLCSCDVFYWRFMRIQPNKVYAAYQDPHTPQITDVDNNVGTFGEACKHCKVSSICNGTYRTAFQWFGDTIIHPY